MNEIEMIKSNNKDGKIMENMNKMKKLVLTVEFEESENVDESDIGYAYDIIRQLTKGICVDEVSKIEYEGNCVYTKEKGYSETIKNLKTFGVHDDLNKNH